MTLSDKEKLRERLNESRLQVDLETEIKKATTGNNYLPNSFEKKDKAKSDPSSL